jgi:hypothetical protein
MMGCMSGYRGFKGIQEWVGEEDIGLVEWIGCTYDLLMALYACWTVDLIDLIHQGFFLYFLLFLVQVEHSRGDQELSMPANIRDPPANPSAL